MLFLIEVLVLMIIIAMLLFTPALIVMIKSALWNLLTGPKPSKHYVSKTVKKRRKAKDKALKAHDKRIAKAWKQHQKEMKKSMPSYQSGYC